MATFASEARPRAAIEKPRGGWRVAPNLTDYDAARASFSWEAARRDELDGLPGGAGLNIAHEAVVRHAAGPLASRTAIRWLGRGRTTRDLTYSRRWMAALPISSRMARSLLSDLD